MDEETEKTEETQTEEKGNTVTDDSQKTEEKETKGQEETVDYEKRYKDLQAEQTRTSQRNAELESRLEQLEQAGPETSAPEDEEFDDEGFVDGKTVRTMIDKAVSQAVSQVRMQTANTYFRKTYPDLVKHESIIAGIMRNPKEPSKLKGASAEDRIDAAVKEFNDLTDEAKASAKAEAETAAKEREEANRKASGLTSSSTTTPKGGDEEISDAQEIANRKTQSAKKRNLV